jgi:hypothetical protein
MESYACPLPSVLVGVTLARPVPVSSTAVAVSVDGARVPEVSYSYS